jgi:hypothetical protein
VLPAPTSAPPVPLLSVSISPVSARTPARRPTSPAASFFTAGNAITARYVITRSRDRTFQGGIFLTNTTNTARNWQVRVTHNPRAGVRMQASFGAQASTSGDTTVFSGGPLAAHSSVMVGFQASKNVGGVVRPTSCRVDGKDCIVSVR